MSSAPRSSSAPLSTVFSIAQVAKMAGWTKRRMTRHLVALNRELGGMLLCNVGRGKQPRWTITLAALQAASPQWLHDPESLKREQERQSDELVELRKEMKHLRKMIDLQTQAIVDLKRNARPAA